MNHFSTKTTWTLKSHVILASKTEKINPNWLGPILTTPLTIYTDMFQMNRTLVKRLSNNPILEIN